MDDRISSGKMDKAVANGVRAAPSLSADEVDQTRLLEEFAALARGPPGLRAGSRSMTSKSGKRNCGAKLVV